ncbi:MAG TPA: 7-carboxy-7-deazaguanine synthase [Allosphingosinicella sp.]|nr:7-carboxy-7-deazaguanine synthase [Allosphingosinicella sp.]
MSYAVKEIFLTLQGEGLQAGRRAVFLRFSGCNLWSGREKDRAGADCTFCDTDFVGTDGLNGGRYDAASLARKVAELWAEGERPLVVVTGGEPLLQLDAPLIEALHARGFEVAVETNGTIAAPEGIDWICVSPKAGTRVVQRSGNELKLVWPQPEVDTAELERWSFNAFLIQPMDGANRDEALAASIDFVMANPRWRLSLQTHKLLGLP